MNEVFIAGAARTPMGGFQGAFAETPAPALGGAALSAALARAGLACDLLTFPAGESSKSRATWSDLTDAMLAAGVGRGHDDLGADAVALHRLRERPGHDLAARTARDLLRELATEGHELLDEEARAAVG